MRKTVTAVSVALGMALGSLGISAAVPASASSSRTYVYALGMGGLWQGPAIRPREIAFGALYDVARLSWSSWSLGTAHGRGHYYGFGSYKANVKLYDVKIHQRADAQDAGRTHQGRHLNRLDRRVRGD
jgi:hypothetical protein